MGMDVIESASSAEFWIPYLWLYETVFSGLRPLFLLLIVIWIGLLFFMLYSIAERHFRWALDHLAAFLRLSPDIAGMTLLAFGNGAPDFFTALFGASQAPELIIGSSVGSGLFISTVVFGSVILFARSSPADCSLPPPPEAWAGLDQPPAIAQDPAAEASPEAAPEAAPRTSGLSATCRLEPAPFIRGSLLYLLSIVCLAIFSIYRSVSLWMPCALLAIYCLYLGLSVGLHYYLRLAEPPPQDPELAHPPQTSSPTDSEVEKTYRQFEGLSLPRKLVLSLSTTYFAVRSRSRWIRCSARVLKTLLAPFSLLFNLTILPLDTPPYHQRQPDYTVCMRWIHRQRIILNPFFSLPLYFVALLGRDSWTVSSCLALAFVAMFLSALLWKGSSLRDPPALFVLHIAHGFCTSILWIYIVSSELVACLVSVGIFSGISTTIVGILVLAWGNSFGDLIADTSISRNGGFIAASTAVFSGPIQNVLLTIGAAFLMAALKSPTGVISLSRLRGDIYLALILLSTTVALCLLLISTVFRFRVPKYFGLLLIVVYLLYLPLAALLGLGIIPAFHHH